MSQLPLRTVRLIGRPDSYYERYVGQAGEIYYDNTNQTLRIYPGNISEGKLLADRTWVNGQIAAVVIPSDVSDLSDSQGLFNSTSLVNGASTFSLAADGTTTFPVGVSIDNQNGDSFVIIRADEGKSLTLQAQGNASGGAGILWQSDNEFSANTGVAIVSANNFNLGLASPGANVRITVQSYDPVGTPSRTKNWIFDENGALTFPDATVQTTAWNGVGDLTGSVFSDDSSIMVDAVGRTLAADLLTLTPVATVPLNPQQGQLAVADGAGWDPSGSNPTKKQTVIYLGSAWVQIAVEA